MSFRGAPRGRGGGGGGRGGFGGGRGGFQQRDMGPPATVLEMGKFIHACEGEMVVESTNPKVPHFNAPIYLENKTAVGKVDEVLGPINQVYFTIKPSEGIQATSFKYGDKFFIAGEKLLPLERFLPKPKPPPGSVSKVKKPSRGGAARGGRGGPAVSRAVAVAAAAGVALAVKRRRRFRRAAGRQGWLLTGRWWPRRWRFRGGRGGGGRGRF
ncbi:H/ACA snoRNP pseudouridylase subunit [Staphylotrichum longicolle]|uniref:H/ACA ribonucleoprotein complex subunit n=1 Tax=Staphylotrichum longicolle TaxID=669026 RepID=A0AAD4ERL6_9PEZI|nr:H/ACA snoRNP pseudouridylase subunit [Staphylotrichum longicolle]